MVQTVDKTIQECCNTNIAQHNLVVQCSFLFLIFLLYHAFGLLEHCVVSCLFSLLFHVGVLLHLCCNEVVLCYICVATFLYGFIHENKSKEACCNSKIAQRIHGTTKKQARYNSKLQQTKCMVQHKGKSD
jgi:hypothetical protein